MLLPLAPSQGSRTASTLSAATLASLGGVLSRRGSCDTSFSMEMEASIRDIKVELKVSQFVRLPKVLNVGSGDEDDDSEVDNDGVDEPGANVLGGPAGDGRQVSQINGLKCSAAQRQVHLDVPGGSTEGRTQRPGGAFLGDTTPL